MGRRRCKSKEGRPNHGCFFARKLGSPVLCHLVPREDALLILRFVDPSFLSEGTELGLRSVRSRTFVGSPQICYVVGEAKITEQGQKQKLVLEYLICLCGCQEKVDTPLQNIEQQKHKTTEASLPPRSHPCKPSQCSDNFLRQFARISPETNLRTPDMRLARAVEYTWPIWVGGTPP